MIIFCQFQYSYMTALFKLFKKKPITDIIRMLDSLIDNTLFTVEDEFSSTNRHSYGNQMLFLSKYAVIDMRLNSYRNFLAVFFKFTSRYIDDALVLHNTKVGVYFERIYPIIHEINDTKIQFSVPIILTFI